jgi:hypothetical protein
MKCKNCGLPRSAHIRAVGEEGPVWKCPNGTGDSYPATTDVKIELHYRAGEEQPWLARWVHPIAGGGEAASKQAADALELAGHTIEKALEEKSADEIALEQAIKET